MSADGNSLQEQYGSNGCVDDAEKNMYCPEQGGPDYKLNYFVDRCRERVAGKTCKNDKCQHFTGAKPTWDEYRRACGDFTDNQDVLVNCQSCGKLRTNHGRGLCKSCHVRHTAEGTLDNFKLKAERKRAPQIREAT